jgi:tRNA modification GTPase
LNLLYRHGARPAEPGEFTKRAFLNGRIDLSQAEAVMDIIQARTQRVSKVAVRQLEGSVSHKLNGIREKIIALLSNIEVNLDYPEYDAEEVTLAQAGRETETIIEELDELIKSFHFGKLLREGMEVVITGRPNVGKSSLMNRLARKNRSIVTDIPGTTRDTIEEFINIKGIPVKIVDTAGVRETYDQVEQQGVERSIKAISDADFAVVLIDVSEGFIQEDKVLLNRVLEEKKPYVLCFNKTDLVDDTQIIKEMLKEYPDAIFMSISENEGIDQLEEYIFGFAAENSQDIDNQVLITNARHELHLKKANEYLESAYKAVNMKMTLDMVALDLKLALEELGKITGHHADEDVINTIFSRFCLGK